MIIKSHSSLKTTNKHLMSYRFQNAVSIHARQFDDFQQYWSGGLNSDLLLGNLPPGLWLTFLG